MSEKRTPEGWARHREQQRAANQARHRAIKRLQAEFFERWVVLYSEEASVRGVIPQAPRRNGMTTDRELGQRAKKDIDAARRREEEAVAEKQLYRLAVGVLISRHARELEDLYRQAKQRAAKGDG